MRRKALAAASLGLALACIIPDRGIRLESEDANPGAVRIVGPAPRTSDMIDLCAHPDPKLSDDAYCAQVPPTLPSGVLRAQSLGSGDPDPAFCVCPGGDRHRLPEFYLYAEDPDRDGDAPRDTLHAVALLDVDPYDPEPWHKVAYVDQFPRESIGELVDVYDPAPDATPDQDPIAPSVGRQDNQLHRFRFGRDGAEGTDLCNDENGNKLSVDVHTLTIMVTDRPFFQPAYTDENGEIVVGPDGEPQLLETQYGVPDLAIGATYSVARFVFECEDAAAEGSDCRCEEDDA